MDGSPRKLMLRKLPSLDTLENRDLLSVLINAQPTLQVIPVHGRVNPFRDGYAIVQPTVIQVRGTAQPPAPNIETRVEIYAEDSQGNLVNDGQPLAVVRPNFLGRFRTTFALPNSIPRDVNYLVAREVATGTISTAITIDPTSLSGLQGNLSIQGTNLRNLTAAVGLDAGTLSGLTGTINNPASVNTINGSLVVPSTPITGLNGSITNTGATVGNIAGSINTPAFPINITNVGSGTAGPAVSTLTGGTATVNPSTSTITGGGASLGALIGNLTSTGTGGATTSTFAQIGTAAESPRTGTISDGTGTVDGTTATFAQTGTAAIAGTTAVGTTVIEEFAVSEAVPLYVHIGKHVPRGPRLGRVRPARA